jgi:type III secretory pathway component EscR
MQAAPEMFSVCSNVISLLHLLFFLSVPSLPNFVAVSCSVKVTVIMVFVKNHYYPQEIFPGITAQKLTRLLIFF